MLRQVRVEVVPERGASPRRHLLGETLPDTSVSGKLSLLLFCSADGSFRSTSAAHITVVHESA